MAGDVQEPLRLSFQADYLHSGSISFGRFETEALCWERRSSFSHNRYLEEVERCSKPGTVTAKKAYFEAHFKRKAFLSQNSLESQNGIDCPNRENENLPDIFDEKTEHFNEDSPPYEGNSSHLLCDQSSTEYELRYSGHREPEITHDKCNSEEIIVDENVGIDETYEVGSGNSSQGNHEPENPVTQNLDCDEAYSNLPLKSSNFVPATPATDMRDCLNEKPDSSPKVKIGSHMKLENFKNTTLGNVKGKESLLNGPSFPAKIANREIRTPSRKEKPIPDSATRASQSVSKPMKIGASKSSKTRPNESRSSGPVKESSSKRTVNSRPSTSGKVASRLQQNANRDTRAGNSAKPMLKQEGSTISFRSDERAERRKQFDTKLGKKLLAKETEAQQVNAKKQGIKMSEQKSGADIKQFRKSQNYKATPIPPFYSEAGHLLDKSKAVATRDMTSNVRNKPSRSSITGSTERPLSSQSVGSRKAGFPTASGNKQSLQLSGETNHPWADGSKSNADILVLKDSESNSHRTKAAHLKALTGKKTQDEVKDSGLQNHRVLESTEMSKGKKLERNMKVGASMTTKDIKGVGCATVQGWLM